MGSDARLWIEKLERLRRDGGMAMVLTHPDYAGDRRVVDGYRSLLQAVRDDPTAWRALPRDVSDSWRRSAASSIEANGADRANSGPVADDGRIAWAFLTGSALRATAEGR